jgi:hypothetical protein
MNLRIMVASISHNPATLSRDVCTSRNALTQPHGHHLFALVALAEADPHTTRLPIDSTHELHLGASFVRIRLINTNLICPYKLRLVEITCFSQSPPQIACNANLVPIARDRMCLAWLTPGI